MTYNWEFLAQGDMWGWTILIGFIAYLLGSISTGRVFAKIKGVDLTKTGSGNVGATNAGRSFGKKGFILVLIGDVAKVILAGGIMQILKIHTTIDFSLPLALAFAIVGNNYPIFHKFKGGKGIAAFGGFMLIIHWPLALVMVGVMIVSMMIGRRVSMASIAASWAGLLIAGAFPYLGAFNSVVLTSVLEPGLIIGMLIISIIVTWKHRSNLKRTFYNEESTVEAMKPFQDVIGKATMTTKWIKEWRDHKDKKE